MENLRRGRHVVSVMHVHLVFVTKYRKPVFSNSHLLRLEEIFKNVCQDFGCKLEEFNGESDHVHILITYEPKVQISKLVNSLKGVSSRLMRKEFKDLTHKYWKGVLWSPSYFSGSVGGAPLTVLKQYIEQQNRPNS